MNREHLDIARSAAQASTVLDAPGPLFGGVPLLVSGAADTHPLAQRAPSIGLRSAG